MLQYGVKICKLKSFVKNKPSKKIIIAKYTTLVAQKLNL
jgi:hypothetical protein